MDMGANVSAIGKYRMPSLPLRLETVKEKLTVERVAEAGVVAATVAAILILAYALRLGLEAYTISGL
jgi:hypothetical protein